MWEIREDNLGTGILYYPDFLYKMNWTGVAGEFLSWGKKCLFAIWSWQEKYFMRIRALSWKFTLCQLISNELKFQILKWWAFVVNIFAKQHWLSENINFQCIFHIFTVSHLTSLKSRIITTWLWNFLETRYQNVPIKRKKCHLS